jgi:2-polyprenyl-6-hydroxyphenyl methylase/3-demethylubiquinone-9 3-methyltransferase
MFDNIKYYFREIAPFYKRNNYLLRIYLFIRWIWTPYLKFADYLPDTGSIIDLGCGHGLLSLVIALKKHHTEVIGVDHDRVRIEFLNRLPSRIKNLKIVFESITGYLSRIKNNKEKYSAVVMIDVIHYFDYPVQERIIEIVSELLSESGIFMMREINPKAGLNSKINYAYEKIATGIGFTKGEHVFLRPVTEWKKILSSLFHVEVVPCSRFPFSDILYVCKKGVTIEGNNSKVP